MLDIKKCEFNRVPDVSALEVANYINSTNLGSVYTIVNHACKCANEKFDLYKIYVAFTEDDNEIFGDEEDAYEKYGDDVDTEILPVWIYACDDCGYWCIDYGDI